MVSIAGRNYDEFVSMAARLDGLPGVAALRASGILKRELFVAD